MSTNAWSDSGRQTSYPVLHSNEHCSGCGVDGYTAALVSRDGSYTCCGCYFKPLKASNFIMGLESADVTKFRGITQQMTDTFSSKTNDYGNSYKKTIAGCRPLLGVMMRLADKYHRAEYIIGGGKCQVKEGLRDTLMDLATYAILGIICMEEEANRAEAS